MRGSRRVFHLAAAEPGPSRLAALIQRRLPITDVPSVPELRLHLAEPRSGLGRLLARDPAAAAPYWAHVWSGGLVLARYLLDHPPLVAGRSVLDLGAGSGLVAIAAARAGAEAVQAVEVDPYATEAIALNAALNGVSVVPLCADILDAAPPMVDVILVGDLFYEAGLATRVAAFLDRCTAAGCLVLVGDPGRAALPLHRLVTIHAAPVAEFGSGHAAMPAQVFRYGAS
ncbi:50S ribosomal protein L11 methyltransferase [Lichenihabitans sp. Uapishka_5]|uniref:class I SAM-dependent methyltransferase n=1 Tax=Lichenihabitans sp. Uapishka_5 TaxID=3037302 RepID=UPI0029E7EF19|nr:50S ribosomal protein L11 methyltransferase [Lichenihabitans sp. Uapishka_5]MDX7950873.1 50S ribosomal protein L11 methyltransferase [Lichenihabitans sp. Uapishka_5]